MRANSRFERTLRSCGRTSGSPSRLRDRAVLVVGRVGGPVGEHDDRRVIASLGRGGRPKRLPEPAVRRLERAHAHAVGHRQVPAERLSRRDRIGDPRRRAHVVLEHHERPVAVADEVESRDRDPAPRRRRQLGHSRLEELRALDRRPRHASGCEDAPLAVDVSHEAIECPCALREACSQRVPLIAFDQRAARGRRRTQPLRHRPSLRTSPCARAGPPSARATAHAGRARPAGRAGAQMRAGAPVSPSGQATRKMRPAIWPGGQAECPRSGPLCSRPRRSATRWSASPAGSALP